MLALSHLSVVEEIAESGAKEWLASFFAFVLGVLVKRSLDLSMNRQFVGLRPRRHISIVLPNTARLLPGSIETTLGAGMPVVTIGVLKAYARVVELLALARVPRTQIGVYISDSFPTERIRDTSFVIGFSRTNEFSATIEERSVLPFAFSGHDIVDSQNQSVLYSAEIMDGRIRTDYGILTVVRNPFNLKADVFMFAGCQASGVSAAAQALDLRNIGHLYFRNQFMIGVCRIFDTLHLRIGNVWLARAFGQMTDFQVVVKAVVFNNDVMSLSFVERRKVINSNRSAGTA